MLRGQIVSYLPMFRADLSVSSSRGPIGCPETSVNGYQSTLPKISEERRSHLHRAGSPKSRTDHLHLFHHFSVKKKTGEKYEKSSVLMTVLQAIHRNVDLPNTQC